MSTPQNPRSFTKEFSTAACDMSVGGLVMPKESKIAYAIHPGSDRKRTIAGSLKSSYDFIKEIAKLDRPTIRFEQKGPCNECLQWELEGVEWMCETGEVLTFIAERLNPHWTGGTS